MKNIILFTFVLLSFLSSCKVIAMEDDDPKKAGPKSAKPDSSEIVLDITDTRFAQNLLANQFKRDERKLRASPGVVPQGVNGGCLPYIRPGFGCMSLESLSTDERSKKRRRDAFRYGIGVEISARDLPEEIYYRTRYYRTRTSCIVPTSPSEENLKSSLGRAEDARDKEKEKEKEKEN